MDNFKVGKLNKEIFETIIREIESTRVFHIINVKFYDEYFIFDKEENSIMHFEIKEIPDYLFGAWIELGNNGKRYIEFFCQHKLYIDKFKPGRGDFEIKVEVPIDHSHIYLGELLDMLLFMKKHIALFFCCGNDITSYIPEWQAKIKMFKTIANTKLYEINKDKIYKKVCKKLRIAASKNELEYFYFPDVVNRGEDHLDDPVLYINDSWIVLTLNKKGKKIMKRIKNMLHRNHCMINMNINVYDSDYPEDVERYEDYVKFEKEYKSNFTFNE